MTFKMVPEGIKFIYMINKYSFLVRLSITPYTVHISIFSSLTMVENLLKESINNRRRCHLEEIVVGSSSGSDNAYSSIHVLTRTIMAQALALQYIFFKRN